MADSPFSSDALAPEEIAALKDLERRNRDRGAAEYKTGQFYGKGRFQLEAENRAYLFHLALEPGQCVLDAGAGLGRLALLVASRVERVVCVDLSSASLDILKAEAAARGLNNVETLPADLCRLPRSLPPFDAAYSIEVVDHIPSDRERLAAVQSFHDRLRPAGRCLVSVHCWNSRSRGAGVEKEGFWGTGERRLYHHYFTTLELRDLLQRAGFQDIRLRGLNVLPGRIARALPPSVAGLELACSTVPAFAGLGSLVIGMGTRKP
ncbi:MAG: class I SAM-dependent methyltransferase [Solirubrobacterales bacterium]|jgi:SAM-dependent methyltransferase